MTGQKMYDDLPVMQQMDCNAKNFPVKCFYNDEKDEIYSFYRQGHSFKIPRRDIENYQTYKVFDGDFGQIVLMKGVCLIVQSSSKIVFLLEKFDEDVK
jgi:hypothetical protein